MKKQKFGSLNDKEEVLNALTTPNNADETMRLAIAPEHVKQEEE